MQFRIGVNLGDVIEEADGTIYGDGVNIAARMEALAEGGGICISSTVYDAVEGKLSFGFDFLGEQQVKNIAKPVRVYRVRAEPSHRRRARRSKRRMAMADRRAGLGADPGCWARSARGSPRPLDAGTRRSGRATATRHAQRPGDRGPPLRQPERRPANKSISATV